MTVALATAQLGLLQGIAYGLLAVGLVLVYRSNRIINFAHGEIGVFSAAVFAEAVRHWHVPYWVGFPLALGLGAGIGAGSETVIVRRLRDAPKVMSVVATLGLGQLLLVLAVVVNGQAGVGALYPKPPGIGSFRIATFLWSSPRVALLVLAPVVIVALTIFLRRSTYGLCIRAAAANPEAARLAGVSASRMSGLSWAIAGGLSAFTAVLVIPTQPIVSGLGPTLLLKALAAAVVAKLTNLPVALGAGVGLGLLEAILGQLGATGGEVQLVMFLVILVALLVQSTPGGGRERERGSWTALQAWPTLSPRVVERSWVLRHRSGLAWGVGLAAALVTGVSVTNSTALVLTYVLGLGLVGVSVGIVTGLAGQLSLGQVGVGAIGAVACWAVSSQTGSFPLGWLCAALAGAATSVLLGFPALRVKGLMLAVTTLAFALAVNTWLLEQSWVLGRGVFPGRPVFGGFTADTAKGYYLVVVAVAAAALWVARSVRTSGFGRVAVALRDNPEQARAFTVPLVLRSLQGFGVAGAIAGLGGALYGHAFTTMSANTFKADLSIDVVAMTLIGGLGLLTGPLLGALFVIALPALVELDNVGLAATKLGALLVLLYAPSGFAGLLRPVRDRVVRRLAGDDDTAEERPPVAFTTPRLEVAAAAGTGDTVLEVRGVSRRFGGVVAVDDVSLAVRAGETLGLIGPNGAGKTTLFEIIGGFTAPGGGQVVLAGDDITGLTPERRAQRGLVRSFQDAPLFPTLTVSETVRLACERTDPTHLVDSAFGLRPGELRKERRARELVGLMGLTDYEHVPVGSLSTGTRRITELACLLALQPRVLLLDEPASGVAQRETEALAGLLERIKGHLGTTLLVIEHDIPLVRQLADRLVAMESGRVVAVGTPAEVLAHPEVVASYLGGDVTAIERSGVARRAPRRRRSKPPAAARCSARTRSGQQCSRAPREAGLCGQHARG